MLYGQETEQGVEMSDCFVNWSSKSLGILQICDDIIGTEGLTFQPILKREGEERS